MQVTSSLNPLGGLNPSSIALNIYKGEPPPHEQMKKLHSPEAEFELTVPNEVAKEGS